MTLYRCPCPVVYYACVCVGSCRVFWEEKELSFHDVRERDR